MYIEYLDDLPKIPQHLLRSYEEISNKDFVDNGDVGRKLMQKGFYATRTLEEDLYAWLMLGDNFPWHGKTHNTNYQLLEHWIPMHKDVGRTVAYNYILYPGGTNVVTSVYDDDKNVLQSMSIEPHRWHRITVDHFHDIKNIEKDQLRIAITVNPKRGK
jgi:hypothetical protein